MSISATIPYADMAAVNAALEAQGFGPDNFSVPARTAGLNDGYATHGALHSWDIPAFLAALIRLQGTYPNLRIAYEPGAERTFDAHIADVGLRVDAPETWLSTKTRVGLSVRVGGKRYAPDYDDNVWPPGGPGWREVDASFVDRALGAMGF